MLGFEDFLKKIFSKKKEKIDPSQIDFNYIHGLIFYNTYFDVVAKSLPKGSLCFLVGGWVRDRILNRPIGKSIDIDFLVTCQPMDVVRNLKSSVGGNIFQFEKEKTVATLIFQEGDYKYRFDFSFLDISDIPEDIEFEEKEKLIYQKIIQDLLNRDFTINAIAVNFDDTYGLSPSQTTLIDPTNGFKDIQEGIIKPISFDNIRKDPVRMMRGYRLAAELDFNIDPEFERFVSKNLNLLKNSPKERIRDEFLKVINGENSYKGLVKLKESGILDFITDNQIEDIDTIKELNDLLKKKDSLIAENFWSLLSSIEFFNELTDLTVLKTVCILNKKNIKNTISKKLLFGVKATNFAFRIVQGLFYLENLNEESSFLDKNIFWYKYEEVFVHIALLYISIKRDTKIINDIQNHYFKFYKDKIQKEPILSGVDIMRILGLKPSKDVGKIKESLILAQLEGKVKNRKEAEEYIKNIII